MKKTLLPIAVLIFVGAALAGCGEQVAEKDKIRTVFFLNGVPSQNRIWLQNIHNMAKQANVKSASVAIDCKKNKKCNVTVSTDGKPASTAKNVPLKEVNGRMLELFFKKPTK